MFCKTVENSINEITPESADSDPVSVKFDNAYNKLNAAFMVDAGSIKTETVGTGQFPRQSLECHWGTHKCHPALPG